MGEISEMPRSELLEWLALEDCKAIEAAERELDAKHRALTAGG